MTSDRYPVKSKYWARQLFYFEHIKSNSLRTEIDVTLTIPSFTTFYTGNYWCKACDVSDNTACIEKRFIITGKYS